MRLAVFDLDGTLADTLAVDHRCFVEAFRLEHGVEIENDDWSTYRHTTDSGIVPEVLERAFARRPTAGEVEGVKGRFLELLSAAAAGEPNGFREVAGAADLLVELARRPDWTAVVATGSWRDSALLKLRMAGLERFGLPLASADDGVERTAIVAHGISLADGGGPLAAGVLLGDKPWDLAAADHFGLGFVGVATASRARLEAAGATWVFDDLSETETLLAALEAAARPPSGKEPS